MPRFAHRFLLFHEAIRSQSSKNTIVAVHIVVVILSVSVQFLQKTAVDRKSLSALLPLFYVLIDFYLASFDTI